VLLRPWWRTVVCVVLVVLLGPALTACQQEVDLDPPKATADSSTERADAAQKSLDRLVDALDDGSRRDAEALAAPAAEQLLGWVHDNAESLRLDDLSMRYVDEGAPLGAGDQARFGQDAWRGTVQLSYRYEGLDRADAQVETSAVFVPTSQGARIAGFGGGDARVPLWLVDRLTVVRTPHTLLAVAGDSAGRYPALVQRARSQVRRVLPSWDGSLLVEVPGSRAQLDAAVQADPGQYDNIAAVTTSADGSLAPGAPVRVFVNPSVFDKLKTRGAQVVMSHEATHVATGATFVSMPTWLLEGFADFVALDSAGVPVDVAAGQILRRIRKDGLPKALPTAADLDPTASGLGATYEEAWLACRFLAAEFGAGRLVRFYREVSDGTEAPAAFRGVLGVTEREFVQRWRADLARLAGVAR
jgi:uncharacterized protein YukE